MTNAIFVLIVSVSLKSIPCKLTLFSLRIRWKLIKISCNLIRELCCYLLRLDETMKAESNLNKANKCWIHSIVSAKACAYWWMNQNAIHYNGMKSFCNLQQPKSIVRRTKLENRRFQNEKVQVYMIYYINALAEDAITWVNFKLFGTCCDCDADVYVGMAFCTTYTTKQSKMWRKYKKVAACSFTLCYISTVRWVPIIHLINYWMKLSHKFSLK